MKLKKSIIKQLQHYIVQKGIERGFDNQSLENGLLKISEETGELIKACRKHTNLPLDTKKKTPDGDDDIGEELVDLLVNVFWTAGKLKIDLEKAFFKKEAKNEKRVWKSTSNTQRIEQNLKSD